MDKIAEVKRAFEAFKEIYPATWGDARDRLQATINALEDEPKPIDLSDLRVGDEVEDLRYGYQEVVKIEAIAQWPIKTKEGNSYTFGGKHLSSDLRPSIIAVRRKPRMVKKTRTVYLNEYANIGKCASIVCYDSAYAATQCATPDATNVAVPYVMKYEEPE